MKIAGILIVIIGAVTVYCSGTVKKLFFKKQESRNETYDMKENIVKLVGVAIAIVGVLMVMFAK